MSDAMSSGSAGVDEAVDGAIGFLCRSQLPYGEFRTYVSEHKNLRDCRFDSSPFCTALVLYCLGFVKDARVQDMMLKGTRFLQEEMEPPGLWRYWSSRNPRHDLLPPDTDDTVCVSFVLRRHHPDLAADSNVRVLLDEVDERGLFHTWLGQIPAGLCQNDVDSVVNANALLYLGDRRPETQVVSVYLNEIVAKDREEGSYMYYFDAMALYYMISRAYLNGCASLEACRDAVVGKVRARQQEHSGALDELTAALSVATLLNFACPDRTVLGQLTDFLVHRQREDGAWPAIPLYGSPVDPRDGFFGSEELTTGFCVEALCRYRDSMA